MFASAILLHTPANAAMSVDPGFQLSAYDQIDLAPLAYIDVLPAQGAIIFEKQSADLLPDASRSTVPLKPEYVASYDTHGLSLVERRWRC
jgi:hypothetical protein